MTLSRTAQLLPRLSLIAVICTAWLAAGCASGGKEARTAAELEAQELRSQVQQLEAALQTAEGRAAALEDENLRLLDENSALAGKLNAASQTGFEGTPGASVSRRGSDVVVDIAGDVLFASGSVKLRPEAQQTLNSIAQVLQSRYGSHEIRIAGHTDTDPIRKSKWETNERLSAERALAVEQYLASQGVSKDRMHIAGFGPAKPRGSKAQSRRVEIIVLGGA